MNENTETNSVTYNEFYNKKNLISKLENYDFLLLNSLHQNKPIEKIKYELKFKFKE